MTMTRPKHSETINTIISPRTCGTYTWQVSTDIVHADAYVASLFGISTDVAEAGLPLVRYLQAIHPDDLGHVSTAIGTAVEGGEAYRAEYRVISGDGAIVPVLAMGQCFRSRDGQPGEYAGMIFDMRPAQRQAEMIDPLSESCLNALEAARSSGNDLVTYLISMALVAIGEPPRKSGQANDILH